MANKEEIYFEEYLRRLNEKLAAHPHFRPNMRFNCGIETASGYVTLALCTTNCPLTDAETAIFVEVQAQLDETCTVLPVCRFNPSLK